MSDDDTDSQSNTSNKSNFIKMNLKLLTVGLSTTAISSSSAVVRTPDSVNGSGGVPHWSAVGHDNATTQLSPDGSCPDSTAASTMPRFNGGGPAQRVGLLS